MRSKITPYLHLMRLNKPIGILLLLWPTLSALWIAANGHPHLKNIILFTLGVIIMRSAGCVINDIADQRFDGAVKRTKDRPLVIHELTTKNAFFLFIFLVSMGAILMVFFNYLTFVMALVALSFIIVYPFTKRFFYLPQLILGATFAMSVILAYTSEINKINLVTIWLYLFALLWPLMYDTIYAMSDRADDLKIGVKSSAILFAKYDRLIIALIQLLVIILLLALGWYLNFKWIYFVCCALGAGFFLYQQFLIKSRHPQMCFKAFMNNQWFGLVIFLGIFLNYR